MCLRGGRVVWLLSPHCSALKVALLACVCRKHCARSIEKHIGDHSADEGEVYFGPVM